MAVSLLKPILAKLPRLILRHCILGPHTLIGSLLPYPTMKRTYTQTTNEIVQNSLKRYIRWYPQDTVTGSNIDTFFELRRNVLRPNTILVGVIYENEKVRHSSKLIDALLADPLSGKSEIWYRDLEGRSKTENNIFTYLGQQASLVLPDAFQRALHLREIPSPILDADTCPVYKEALPQPESAANSLQIIEVNKPADIHKVVDVCSFYVYVASALSSLLHNFPLHVQHKILATVVDNKEYTPRSTEATPASFSAHSGVAQHVIKVNSEALIRGINSFYKLDTEAASDYFESVQASNMLELRKLLLFYTRTENLSAWMFALIKTEISSNDISEAQIRLVYEDLKLNTLVKGSQQMHAELQDVFVPETRAFFRRKLPWYMLYFRNDNVEYTVKDFFSERFMARSIDSYNYLKGQVVARLQEQKFAHYLEKNKLELTNPLQAYKAELINSRVPREIQLAVYTSLASAFVYYQLPLSAMSLIGYIWMGLDLNAACAIAALGWVLGFNHVSKTWHKFTESWLKRLFDDMRLVIAKKCVDQGLLKELNTRLESAKDLARIKQLVLADLERASGEKQLNG